MKRYNIKHDEIRNTYNQNLSSSVKIYVDVKKNLPLKLNAAALKL